MSSVFHKYSANKNSCCASAMHKKETCFSGPDSGRFFAFFFLLVGLDIWGRSELWIMQ